MSRLTRVLFWQITLLPAHLVTFLALVLATAFEAAAHGPYTITLTPRPSADASGA